MAHNSIGRSIREVVRQYREELSCQTACINAPLGFDVSPGRMSLKNEEVACEKKISSPNEGRYGGTRRLKDKRSIPVQKLCWHETPDGTVCSPKQEKTGSCTSLRFPMDDLADFQDLDRRAAEVLRRSQQVIEGGQACKSSAAPMSKQRLHLNHTQVPSYLFGSGHSPPHSSGTVARRNDKNHCRARDVVARNFEEIDKILGESNLIMDQSSSSDIQQKVSGYSKDGIDTRQASIESVFELRQGSHGVVKHLKQDIEAREVAAIRAANDYLNKNNGHPNILLSERLLENPKTCADKELITTCRRLLKPSDGLVETADQACCPSTFNTNKQQEWPIKVSLPSASLVSCNGTKICETPMPTSSVTPTNLSESKCLITTESDRQWLSKDGHLNSGKVDSASMIPSKGTWKYADKFNFGESRLGSIQSLDLDGRLPMSSRKCAISTKQRPSTVDIQQFPFTTKKKSIKKSCKSRDMSSIQMPVSHIISFGQEVGIHDPELPVSENQSCAGRLRKGVSRGSACLEDGMKRLSTEDLLLTLKNPREVRESLRSFLSKDRDTSCEGRRTYRPEECLSLRNSSSSPTFVELESARASSFAGGLEGNDEESTAYSGILASLEQGHEEAHDRTSALASGSHRYVLKSNAFQRSKVRHSELATQLLCSSAKCRGTRDKDNKSPAWIHSLNVRKPSKWRAMSITHTRLQASAPSHIKGTVVVEELEELALRCNQLKDANLPEIVNINFKERCQEDSDYRAANASTPNDNLVFDHCRREAGYHFPAPAPAKTIETREVDALVSKSIADGAVEISETCSLSGQAGRQLESSFAPHSDCSLKHRSHGSNGLPNEIFLPREVTVRENHLVTSSFVAKKDPRFDNLPTNESLFSSELDSLISEVVHEWVEVCSTSSPNASATSGTPDTRAVSPITTCSITDGDGIHCPGAEYESSPEKGLKNLNGMQPLETGNGSANQDLFIKVQGSKAPPRDSELVKVVKKNSVVALASVLKPLLAALQEAEIDETIVTEFEADETVRLLLEKLQFYEKKIRALKNRRDGNENPVKN
ncbi:hypothetical protein KC19_6G120200 [Ceratodon purpureus]|uniref:Uncharacterized protein n=1 Tax=Ceratodon purpureus TaxID=3225 RepID=A0A8T0HFW5_CERPU|nr:hypothetical protein KC19_6G120200 [Ceratodon purpureus]